MPERFLHHRAVIALSLLFVHSPLRAYSQDKLADILTTLRIEEKRYENIDLLFNREYEVVDAKIPADDRSNASKSLDGQVSLVQFVGKEVLKRDERIRFVQQRGMVHIDWKANSIWSDGSRKSRRRALCFDGAVSRLMDSTPPEKNYSSHVIMGKATVLPHTLVIGNGIGTQGTVPPLSSYLKGGQSIKVTYQGEELFQGLTCKKVQITRIQDNEPSLWQELWLAESRNLIPVRRLEYKSRLSAKLPHAEASVKKWKELQPGTWFPVSVTSKKYESIALQQTGVQKLRWEKRFVADKIVLNPNHPRQFFGRLPDSE